MTDKLSAEELEEIRGWCLSDLPPSPSDVDRLFAHIASLAAEAERMREALAAAARAFRIYEKYHRAKGTEDSDRKAAINAEDAEMCERAALKEQP